MIKKYLIVAILLSKFVLGMGEEGNTEQREPDVYKIYIDIQRDGKDRLKELPENLRVLKIWGDHYDFHNMPLLDDADLELLSSLTKLEYLSIKGGKITDEGLLHLSGLTNLKTLKLQKCHKIRAEGLNLMSFFANLETLFLVGCPGINFEFLKDIGEFVNLRELNLSGIFPYEDKISDYQLKYLTKAFPNLEVLGLSCCSQITGEGLNHLSVLSNLRILDLIACRSLEIVDKWKLKNKLLNLKIIGH